MTSYRSGQIFGQTNLKAFGEFSFDTKPRTRSSLSGWWMKPAKSSKDRVAPKRADGVKGK